MGTIRTIQTDELVNVVKEMCIKANHFLAPDMDRAMKDALESERSPLGKQILSQLQDNLRIAGEEMIPICQDTGMAVLFVEIGQDVHFEGMLLEDALNEGVRRGYAEGFLRKSVVSDPLLRVNTKDNTPAIIHYFMVAGDKVKITFAPKGFGSENMSRVFMLKPAEGEAGVKKAILTAVDDAGPNACPPMVVGVGVGGDFEKAAIMAKQALTREERWAKDRRCLILQRWKKKCFPRSISWVSDREVLEELPPHWQSISTHILHTSQAFLWLLTFVVM